MTSDLPLGWTWAKLGDLGVEIRGQLTPEPGTTYDLYSVPTFPTGRPERIDGAQVKSGKRGVQPDDVLLCKINPRINRVWVVGQTAGHAQIASTEYLVLRPHEPRMSSFIQQYLSSPRFRDWIKLSVEGATGSHTRAKSGPILQQTIPIAPLAEQQRIIAAIEEHFSHLNAAASALSAAQRRLDALLPSALRTLCDGSWIQLPLAHIIKSLKNGVFVSRPSTTPPGHPIYRISAVRPLMLRIDDVRYANPVPNGASSYAVEAGDILFTRYSGNPDYVGAAAVVPHEGAGVLHPDKLIRVIADRDVALPEWIAAYVTAGTGRREVEKRLKTTAGQVGISGSQLGSVPIAVPPMSYQQQATDRIGHVLAEQTRIRQILSSTETTVGSLRRSILSVAFSGRLVPQDPTDEPASVLLERIAASRTAKPKRQKVKA